MRTIFHTDKTVYIYFHKLNLLSIVVQCHQNEKPTILPFLFSNSCSLRAWPSQIPSWIFDRELFMYSFFKWLYTALLQGCFVSKAKLMKQCVAGGGLLWPLDIVNSNAARRFHIQRWSFLWLHFWPGFELQLLLVNCWSGGDITMVTIEY